MKKKMVSVFVIMAMLMSFIPIAASATKGGSCGDDLTWTLEDGTLTISGTGAMDDWKSYKNVIWSLSRDDITIVKITEGVTSIGDYAFSDCSSLSSVEIPNSVTSIGDYAFEDCSSLSSIEIPSSVTSIGTYAFYWCSSLSGINIPNSVTYIGNSAFVNCRSLANITVDENNQYYSSADNVLFDKNKTILMRYAPAKTDTEYEVPNTVTNIGDYAFQTCKNLSSITIPDSVMNIGDGLLVGCSSLINITVDENNQYYSSADSILFDKNKTILMRYASAKADTEYEVPNTVTSIGDYAFSDCGSLSSIEIPNNVTSIGDYTFYNCSSLSSIEIPNSVTSIGDGAFDSCSSLSSIEIPDSITSITDDMFFDCSSLTGIEIPNSVTSIGDNAFEGCSRLSGIEIPDSVTSIGDDAFCDCSSLSSIVLSNNITSIGDWTFWNCSSLSSIKIPDKVTDIGDYAFNACSSLSSIDIPNSVTSIGKAAFEGCRSLTDVYYSGSEEEWQNISVDERNEYLTHATIHYNGNLGETVVNQISISDYTYADGSTVIKAVAQNNTEATVSCKIYSAVYTSDGKLKATGMQEDSIDADSNKEITVTVPCKAETDDVIKTYMWDESMKALAPVAELTAK